VLYQLFDPTDKLDFVKSDCIYIKHILVLMQTEKNTHNLFIISIEKFKKCRKYRHV